jgi:hypothetical protein
MWQYENTNLCNTIFGEDLGSMEFMPFQGNLLATCYLSQCYVTLLTKVVACH